jgi:hypothetical protein
MKPLLLIFALGTMAAVFQESNAAEVVHNGARGTAVHTGGGTAVHTNYNYDNVYWHTHKYGYLE